MAERLASAEGTSDVPPEVLAAARSARSVCVLTGAGMSAESGVPTFRDAQTGLWERFSAEELATPQAWEQDRAMVWAWYRWRFGLVHQVTPNANHLALARWARLPEAPAMAIVTQNVDDLHERAGSEVLAHLHGSLSEFRCERCDAPWQGSLEPMREPVTRAEPPTCPRCAGAVRPGVVWFGEALPLGPWQLAERAVEAADLVLVVGTSGLVYPAAGLPMIARAAGATTIEINPVETAISDHVHLVWRGTAARCLPALVDALS